MNKTIKTKWLKALRSGDYQQTTGRLCRVKEDGDKFCCLGVLIDIEYDGDWILEQTPDYSSQPSQPFQEWYDIKGGDKYGMSHQLNQPFLTHCKITQEQQDELSAMNDKGDSFIQIADHIETNL